MFLSSPDGAVFFKVTNCKHWRSSWGMFHNYFWLLDATCLYQVFGTINEFDQTELPLLKHIGSHDGVWALIFCTNAAGLGAPKSRQCKQQWRTVSVRAEERNKVSILSSTMLLPIWSMISIYPICILGRALLKVNAEMVNWIGYKFS